MPSSSSNEFQAILQTAIMFGVISIIVYFAVLRTTREAAAPRASDGAVVSPQQQAQEQEKPNAKPKILCSRVPPHLSESTAKITQTGGANILSDGMVAFRHIKAASHESSLSPEMQMTNRKERAKVLSNLLAESNGALSSPPAKGGSVVLTVPVDEIECEKSRRIVYLLATYYNLLLIVSVDSSFQPKDMKNLIQRLRGSEEGEPENYLSPEVLPDHRVTASCSVTGRVAFVRQLQRIELVLDFDAEVKDNLSRFGHRVILYGSNHEPGVSNTSRSRLGMALLWGLLLNNCVSYVTANSWERKLHSISKSEFYTSVFALLH